jgi:histidyl-tRNA synthetase
MINKPRGTEDITGIRARKFNAIENIIAKISALYGYNEIRTPIFENIEVFVRSVGATSDIVKKEFYNFTDKGGREIALRPEGTAAVIRSVVENKLLDTQPLPIKFSYTGPMFRYERPQSGRMRQFHQYGFEVIGTNSVYDDADVLAMAIQVLKTIGIKDYKVIINNLGNFESRGK